MYTSRVRSTTGPGSGGGGSGPPRSQPDSGEVSQSLTYCLSSDGWLRPGSHRSAGQNLDESGVSTSSASTSPPPGPKPSSILVSATMMPRPAASSAPLRYTSSVIRSSSAATPAPTRPATAAI